MQLYFHGNFNAAQQQLTALIQKGHVDARLHYFRGLSSVRLGDTKSADLDFQKGAELEVAGAGSSIGQALQRVQGSDRLRLEKYRRMAKLMVRRRMQPVAPKPMTGEQNEQLIGAVDVESSPTFRLASEIPFRRAVLPDPFADDPARLLAQERLPRGPEVPTALTTTESDEAPVGTGVAIGSAKSSEASTTFDAEVDAFAEDVSAAAQASPRSKPSSSPIEIFGAVFRAIRKATIPQVNPGAMLPPGMLPAADGTQRPPVNQFPEDSFPEDDPFENMDEGDDELFGNNEDDPFGIE